MKKIAFLALLSSLGTLASAQLVVNPSVNGWASASTDSWVWEYVSVGGGRGSHNHAWEAITKQTSSASAPALLNGSTPVKTASGTFFSPTYFGRTQVVNSFQNLPTEVVFNLSIVTETSLNPTLGAYGGASVNADGLDEFFFALPKDAHVSTNLVASANTIVGLKNLTNGDEYFWTTGSASFASTLPGGCEYELFVHSVGTGAKDGYKKTSSGLGVVQSKITGTLVVTPSSAGNGGDGGDDGGGSD